MSTFLPIELFNHLLTLEADADVVDLLEQAGYWDNPSCWRYYGDNELNWSQAGGQQARADFALNEKVVNSIDSVLTRLCLEADVSPESDHAPTSIRAAVSRFIEGAAGNLKTTGGRVEDWPATFRTKVAENISVFVTERDKSTAPSVYIADIGEGHTPEAFPVTFVSLGQRNKVGVPFVQGKFCQGGSGVSRYGGENRLQLIVSRRRPSLLSRSSVSPSYPVHDTDDQWGFTIVRRETGAKLPFLSYLAPIDSETHPRRGRVLRFAADDLPLFPEGDQAFKRRVESGTLIKLYEYQLRATSNIIRRAGLLAKLDLLLPEPALPFRIHECRPRHHENASKQETTVAGLFARLGGSTDSLEKVAPDVIRMRLGGRDLDARIFAFKPQSSKTYRTDEGVVFTVNGQTHGYMKASFFARPKVGLQRLAPDLLVVVDCTSLDPTQINDLFMSSRDRLAESPIAKEIEAHLQEELSSHEGLKALKNCRIQDELRDNLSNNKPIEDVLRHVFRRSPTLARLFGQGDRLSNPFKPEHVQPAEVIPLLRLHPTFFRFVGKEAGFVLNRVAHIGQKCRIQFLTDAEDHYFTRKYDPGEFTLVRVDAATPVTDYVGPNLAGGKGTLSFDLPAEAKPGDKLSYCARVVDDVTQATFENYFELTVAPAQEHQSDANRTKRKPAGQQQGPKPDGAAGIAFPEVYWLGHGSPSWVTHFRTKADCLQIMDDGETSGSSKRPQYKFYMNEDNPALGEELKAAKANAPVVKKQYEVAAVLVGLALIHDENSHKPKDEDEDATPLHERVQDITRALAPFLIPMIQGLGDLGADDVDMSDLAGQVG
jgi:hypothetical protein